MIVQIWSNQEITNAQWRKLDYLIKVVKPPFLAWEVIEHPSTRHYREEKNPRNIHLLKKAYDIIRGN